MKVLKIFIHNFDNLDGCIVECFIVEEVIEFCLEYLVESKLVDWCQPNDSGVLGKPNKGDRNHIGHKYDSFIMAFQAKQVFYIQDDQETLWWVVLTPHHRDYIDTMNNDVLGDISIKHDKLLAASDMNDDGEDENQISYTHINCETWYFLFNDQGIKYIHIVFYLWYPYIV